MKNTRNYEDVLEHLDKMLRIHSFLRYFCITYYLCPFLKPRIPVLIFDDVQLLFKKGKIINSKARLILERYAIYWLDNGLANIVFITSECGTFTSIKRLSGWSSRLQLLPLQSLEKEKFDSLIKQYPYVFKRPVEDYDKFYMFFEGDLRTLQRLSYFRGSIEGNILIYFNLLLD